VQRNRVDRGLYCERWTWALIRGTLHVSIKYVQRVTSYVRFRIQIQMLKHAGRDAGREPAVPVAVEILAETRRLVSAMR